MIYITQLIYITPGQEETFEQFEKVAIPIISKYNGRLLLRVRPSDTSFVECRIEKPFEIHFVEFERETDFEHFMQDKERQQYLHLKEQSIKTSLLVMGKQL